MPTHPRALVSQDVVVKNSVLWNQGFGNCQEIGFELYNARVSNITFDSNTCFHQSGSIASIHNGGAAVVEDVLYTNITAQGVFTNVPWKPSQWSLRFVMLTIPYGQYSGPDVSKRGSVR
jgi:hypothetical protein